jgi:decaprenyl-phosphate phosphoribosyltransferase
VAPAAVADSPRPTDIEHQPVARPGRSAPDAEALPRARRGRLRAIVATARPRQWVKNALVVAAPGAAGALGRDDVLGRVTLACIAFCLISAGIYAINDVRDVAEDRRHPRKRFRPVAAGELGERDALLIGIGWLVIGLVMCVSIRPLLGLVALAYAALTVSYTLALRYIVVLDIVAIAGGFVLRALAGGVAAPVTLSRWFVLVVTALALFIAAGKRQAELFANGSGGREGGRRVLAQYTPGRLRLLLSGSAACALFAYYVWAFELSDVDTVPWRLLTVIPFTLCVLRYWSLVRSGDGEAPEELILSDRVLLSSAIAWLLLFALGVHAGVG